MVEAIDDSCRRPGAIPFSWEICPGTPKHVRSSSASVPSTTFSSAPSSKVAVTPKLTPPPSMAPSPYHSPRVSSSYAYSSSSAGRSASVSPSRRQLSQQHRQPTAFLDVAPRVAAYRGAGPKDYEEETAAYNRCFPLPVFRRRDGGRKGGSGRRSSTSSSSGGSFRSDGAPVALGGLRRSASSSSSSCLSLSSGSSSNKFAAPREVEAATGWFF